MKLKIINSFANLLRKLAVSLNPEFQTIQFARVDHFYSNNGNEKLYNFQLDENSTVIDLGGYVGGWTAQISSKYNCKIFIFEPCLEYYQIIEKRFKSNKKVIPLNLGLSGQNVKLKIHKNGVSSSIFPSKSNSSVGEVEEIELLSAKDFLFSNSLLKVNLIKINIEGGEFDLLEYLIDENLIERFDNILVQFHENFHNDSNIRMAKIHSKLSNTHFLTFQFPFVWENWKRKVQ
ncbi:FkbM family methyltransferase [Lacihabitans soyangensis]|uniref:FkbM family methyltransferase n=2 Tax=Lacihabitans soyangensis TaxID=869394 RepID=A0AAE3H1H2_9BACT|nr:FkbM family methyltransferase [Lacihabitans soyangensis]